ncbi:MAG: methylornithine synthase PylB [Oscillospiraceae bacterium]|jgi:methylornithine synthase|nr:methylornithine synthase PylB [Oscillospiraceae bacterium]
MTRKILEKLRNGAPSNEEIVYLLTSGDRELIFAAARETRQKHFGNKVFSYGFVYFSTHCRNDCAFCCCRRSNRALERYRKSDSEIVEHAVNLEKSGVNLIDLTMGEDEFYTEQPARLAAIIREVKNTTGLSVMVSPGVISRRALEMAAESGADWLALYQETHNRELFKKRRVRQNFDERMNLKRHAASLGILVEEGIMAGIGESPADHAVSFGEMRRLNAFQIRSMRFVPQEGTPMAEFSSEFSLGNTETELLDIAVMRLLFPDRLIPASLDVEGLEGLKARLNAGANVITSLIPPDAGLMGVSQREKDIRSGCRTLRAATPILEELGLRAAANAEYSAFLAAAKAGVKYNSRVAAI